MRSLIEVCWNTKIGSIIFGFIIIKLSLLFFFIFYFPTFLFVMFNSISNFSRTTCVNSIEPVHLDWFSSLFSLHLFLLSVSKCRMKFFAAYRFFYFSIIWGLWWHLLAKLFGNLYLLVSNMMKRVARPVDVPKLRRNLKNRNRLADTMCCGLVFIFFFQV